MPLPALVERADLAVVIGREIDASEHALIDDVLRRVSAIVRQECGRKFVDENDELQEVPEVVRAVVLAVARRAFENPRGVGSNQIGGYSERLHESQSLNIFLHDTERRMLRGAVGKGTAGSISVPLAHPWRTDGTVYAYASEGFWLIPMEEA